ncbi:hypothetical protein BKA70DRAFT_1185253 [Coprinopsis sp. MPI-PUGE-AT-0042]|nr:hypothetical protein BKA70DRAFT_1185253 [Coprinopsis sp. MPI-PUGE-AT-0042]
MEDEATATSPSGSGNSSPSQPDATKAIATRAYQQEMLDESLKGNIIIALDTGSGKTHIAVLRIKHELERRQSKICWFVAPTVALCQQQRAVIKTYVPGPVGIISGAHQPEQWKNATLWKSVLDTHRIIVSTPQVFLDGLRHGYINMATRIGLLIFDEAHHAVEKHPYNMIMQEFYFCLAQDERPKILGLTASPIYGSGDVTKAFKTIEGNLDASICTPRYHRNELAQYVHRPIFKHAPYSTSASESFSTNLATLSATIKTLNIENDPYVIALRKQLGKASTTSPEFRRLDQKLSKVLMKQDSFTHRGLRDIERAASDICTDIGAWAADWYVWTVVEKAKHAANPYHNIMSSWKSQEKRYLLQILQRLVLSPVSYYEDDILEESSDKVRALVECLLTEKEEVEQLNQPFSGIIFVQRRDAVLALAELLRHHPVTKEAFDIGVLLGTSESAYRHAIIDVTRNITKQGQDETIAEFKIGQKNLIISTSVAEEGIDIPACGSVIRWDPPLNMASWIQSRGRARRQRSTFTLMYDVEEPRHQQNVSKWRNTEEAMVDMYRDPSRALPDQILESDDVEPDDFDEVLRIESTGAFLNPHSAVSHLSHFCAVISRSGNAENQPIYDIDPPDFVPGWHALDPKPNFPQYLGPWTSKVTLPRSLPIPVREFSTDHPYRTKLAAHRHAAFKAYKSLYELGLLNENLLPFSSQMDPELEEEVQAMLADIEKRSGTADVGLQMDPWEPQNGDDVWHLSEIYFTHATPLLFLTRRPMPETELDDGPTLHQSGRSPIRVGIYPTETVLQADDPLVAKARVYTRTLFWCLNGSRMDWDNTNFSYLFLLQDHEFQGIWEGRRERLEELRLNQAFRPEIAFTMSGEEFIREFGCVDDLTMVRKNLNYGRPYSFVRWQYDPLPTEEEEAIQELYARQWPDLEVTYPLMVVTPYPPRTNFLIPTPAATPDMEKEPPKELYLVPHLSGIALYSPEEVEYIFLLPSVLRWLSIHLTMTSLRDKLFMETPLSVIPSASLANAMIAPASGERQNYQRLETLGDTVLKFVTGLQLFAEYPVWHEGYLTRKKDHAVSNVRLAKEDIRLHLYRWIIRDRMLGKKWKPKYGVVDSLTSPTEERSPTPVQAAVQVAEAPIDSMIVEEGGSKLIDNARERKKKKKKRQQKKALSTKVLADVVESLIGAAYLHGGFDLGYECIKFFDLGVKWQPIETRLSGILARVLDESDLQIPPQIADVEAMFGYTFNKKILLIEALTHASYQDDTGTISYERLEFIGDSVLDMIVTDYLYRAPGKEYSPGHIHLRRSSVVNGHFLAYICLSLRWENSAIMPQPVAANDEEESFSLSANSTFVPRTSSHETYLWQCLLHSSDHVLDDLNNTFTRYQNRKEEIREALETSSIFPWAALTRLQAPKFFSDIIESIIGAAYIDSRGNMDVIRGILRRIGILPVLERIVRDDVSVLHPVSRLSMWAARNQKEIDFSFIKERGNIACIISVDGTEEVRETERYRGMVSQEEVNLQPPRRQSICSSFAASALTTQPAPKPGNQRRKKTSNVISCSCEWVCSNNALYNKIEYSNVAAMFSAQKEAVWVSA